MKSLLNKGLLLLGAVAFILVLSNPAEASASETPVTPEKIEVLPVIPEFEVSPMWVYSYTETVTVEYPTSSIPNEFHYEYYHNTYGMMRGVLKYVSHSVVKGKYVAKFRGTMYSNPL